MKLILAICLILAIVSAQGDTCADHPILKRLKVFKESIKGDIPAEARESLDAAVTTFEENDSPAADTDMVRCDAFKDDDTCCTKEFTDLFPKFMRASFKSRQKIRPKILSSIQKLAFGIAQCKGKDVVKEFMESMKEVVEKSQKCRLDGMKGEINWQRGTLCAICSAPADLATTFDGYTDNSDDEVHKLKVTQDAADNYQEAIDGSADCMNLADTDFKEKMAAWAEKNLEGCRKLNEQITKMKEDDENKTEKPDCKSSGMLGGGCLRHQEESEEEGGEKGGDEPSGDEPRPRPQRRQLEESEYVVDSDGVNSYITDDEMEAEFDELAAEDDFAAAVENSEDLPEKEEGLDESEEDDEESSASALAISAVLALVLIVV